MAGADADDDSQPRRGGAWIPPWILRDGNLSASVKLLAGRLYSLANERGYAFAGNDFLSEDMGISPRAVRRRIASLKEAGHIRVELKRHPQGTERRVFFTGTHRPEVSGGGGRKCPVGEDESVRSHYRVKRESEEVEKEDTSEIQGDLLEESGGGNGTDPLERVVDDVWEATLQAWKGRVGTQPGPDLQRTDGRESRIRARARECLEAGASPQEAVLYLSTAARGFYADDWEERDDYLDPGKYLFRDDGRVRRFFRQGRREKLGLSKADAKRAKRVAEILDAGA